MTDLRFAVAQHEAAHVVVGVALGLRLHVASARPAGDCLGYAWFPWVKARTADALLTAAGIAWDRKVGGKLYYADLAMLRQIERSATGVRCAVRAAGAMLAELGREHAAVTRALLERDLTGHDLLALARGERLEPA